MITPARIFEVFEDKKRRKIYTKNLIPGKQVYGERLVREKGTEYREWNPNRSKLAAAIAKGASNIGIRSGSTVLYLGCSTGTTVSHVSDMVGLDGGVFGVDPAPVVMREFVFMAEERKNVAPILADANKPEEYADKMMEVDVVFQDIAQRNQTEIFLKNLRFLKKGGFGLLAVKSRSIDITKKPKQIFNEVRLELEKHITVVDYKMLDPFEKDHCMIIVKKK